MTSKCSRARPQSSEIDGGLGVRRRNMGERRFSNLARSAQKDHLRFGIFPNGRFEVARLCYALKSGHDNPDDASNNIMIKMEYDTYLS